MLQLLLFCRGLHFRFLTYTRDVTRWRHRRRCCRRSRRSPGRSLARTNAVCARPEIAIVGRGLQIVIVLLVSPTIDIRHYNIIDRFFANHLCCKHKEFFKVHNLKPWVRDGLEVFHLAFWVSFFTRHPGVDPFRSRWGGFTHNSSTSTITFLSPFLF